MIGQRIKVLIRGSREIIGVVGDVKVDVYGKPTAGLYVPHPQLANNRNWPLTQVVATDGSPEAFSPPFALSSRRSIRSLSSTVRRR